MSGNFTIKSKDMYFVCTYRMIIIRLEKKQHAFFGCPTTDHYYYYFFASIFCGGRNKK